MATVPLSGTNILFLSGVPFSNDYKHTRYFDTLSAQQTYFGARTVVHSMTDATFQRIEGQTYIKCDKSIDELWGTNYLMFQNTSYNSKWFYAFVTKLEYKNNSLTYVHFEIDVFQTWLKDYNFKPSFVLREHCKLWEIDGSPVINTVDEGLNYGTEYDILDAHHYLPSDNIYYLVIVSKTTLHNADSDTEPGHFRGSFIGGPTPLCYYVHPFMWDSSSGVTDLNVSIGIELFPLTPITQVLATIFSTESAVNNIVSLYITEHYGATNTYDFSTNTLDMVLGHAGADITAGTTTIKTVFVDGMTRFGTTTINTGDKYFNFPTGTESKLLMYPYSLTILDDFRGNRITIKNEYIEDTQLMIEVMGSLGTSNKVAYIPEKYNTTNMFSDTNKSMIEHSLINNTPQDVPILTDLIAAFFQGNRNQIENQKNSIIFNGVMDSVGGAIGATASAVMGNPFGLAAGATQIVKGAGNTQLQLQGIMAKIKDINNQPPNMVKMGSNTAFDFGNDYTGFYVIKKQIKEEYYNKLENYFKMYGYKMNDVKIPNFHTRQNWNYVQTKDCNITGNFNNEDLQELKSIFDNGITLWHTDDIGNYALSNGVIA